MTSRILPLTLLVAAVAIGAIYYFGTSDSLISDVTGSDTVVGASAATEKAEVKNENATAPRPVVAKTQRLFENGRWVTIVKYSSTGFNPSLLTLHAGEEVRFINTTTLTMRVSFQKAGAPEDILGINQDSSVGKNGTYQVAMMDKGVWTFYNLNGDRKLVGVINVE